MIPLAIPNLAGRESEYLQECVSSTYVSSVGPFVTRFESAVAAAAGTGHAVATSSGTTGLHLALTCVGVRRDDLVVLPSLTFIASANAIAHCGATPWLFDVSEESWTLDPDQVATALRQRLIEGDDGPIEASSGRRVAAILAVHTLGHPADMDPLVEVAADAGIPIIADAAAALGASYRGHPIGRTGATLSVFSFNGNKTVTAGGGGAVVGSDDQILDRARHLSTTARAGDDYDHDEVGFNYRMTNLQAAVGCAQLERLDALVTAKRRIRTFYEQRLGEMRPGIRGFPQASWAASACWFSGILLEGFTPSEAQQLRGGLQAAGIDARPFWKPMHLQRPYRAAPREPMLITDELWQRVVTLPCSTGITDDELHQVEAATRALISEMTL